MLPAQNELCQQVARAKKQSKESKWSWAGVQRCLLGSNRQEPKASRYIYKGS